MEQPNVYIFGHKNPDTDSICSSVAYEALKRKCGMPNATAYRLGDMNIETKFVLKAFGIEPPPLLEEVKVTLKDLILYHPEPLNKTEPLKKAWDVLMSGAGARLLPIVDADNKVEGIVSLSDITKIFMESSDETILYRYEVRYDNLIKILEGEIVHGGNLPEALSGHIYVGSSKMDDGQISEKDILITSKAENACYYANARQCGFVILTNGHKAIDPGNARCPVMCVRYSLHTTLSLLKHAISIRSFMNTQSFEVLSTENTVEDAMGLLKTSAHRNFPVVDREGRLYGLISRRHLIEYNKPKVILIDHNERQQSVKGVEKADILEIIDHHRVADVQTDSPLYVRSEPVGCTSTIIYKLYWEKDVDIDKSVAGIMLSAILSDTLMFRSPTCTAEDRQAAEGLAEIAGVNLETYGAEMFAAGSVLTDYTPEEILAIDRKRFLFDHYLIYISQVNTQDFNTIVAQKQAFLEAMDAFKESHDCDMTMLVITDILLGGSEILIRAQGPCRELLSAAFGLGPNDDSMFLPGVVSRKKQIVPKLSLASKNQ